MVLPHFPLSRQPILPKVRAGRGFPQPDAQDMKLAEMMVLAYRVYQDEYDETPSILRICRATGLSKSTIAHADKRLIGLGLLESDPPAYASRD